MDAFKEGWYYLFVIVSRVMMLYFKRESTRRLCLGDAGDPELMVWTGALEARNTAVLVLQSSRPVCALVRRAQTRICGACACLRDSTNSFRARTGAARAGCSSRTERQGFVELIALSRLRPPDRRVLADRRDLQPRQRSSQHGRRQRLSAAHHVRGHQHGPGIGADHHVLLHLPRHPGRTRAGKARPQQDGGAHVHLLLGHAVAITPPVAIARSPPPASPARPPEDGMESMWVGRSSFHPFFFVLNPALLLQGIIRISKRSG